VQARDPVDLGDKVVACARAADPGRLLPGIVKLGNEQPAKVALAPVRVAAATRPRTSALADFHLTTRSTRENDINQGPGEKSIISIG
jgi:hypothetical protein